MHTYLKNINNLPEKHYISSGMTKKTPECKEAVFLLNSAFFPNYQIEMKVGRAANALVDQVTFCFRKILLKSVRFLVSFGISIVSTLKNKHTKQQQTKVKVYP